MGWSDIVNRNNEAKSRAANEGTSVQEAWEKNDWDKEQVRLDRQAVENEQRMDNLYGSTWRTTGAESEDYTNRLKGNLDKDVARADIINQQGANQRAIDNARAGLSGVDLTAQNEQNRRNTHIQSDVINEQAKRDALNLYGESIGNRITGASEMSKVDRALALAQTMDPTTQADGGGILSSIFGGLF